jgi:predicted DNA-binding transcriptional regulator AlpA
MAKVGLFPRPVKIGNKNAWIESEIDAWIAERIQERDAVA